MTGSAESVKLMSTQINRSAILFVQVQGNNISGFIELRRHAAMVGELMKCLPDTRRYRS